VSIASQTRIKKKSLPNGFFTVLYEIFVRSSHFSYVRNWRLLENCNYVMGPIEWGFFNQLSNY
jgi:hypothetical protein